MTSTEGNSYLYNLQFVSKEYLLWEIQRFEGNKINCFPRNQSLSDLSYNVALSTFTGNSALLLADVIDCAVLPAQRFWQEKIFIVRCHVTSK